MAGGRGQRAAVELDIIEGIVAGGAAVGDRASVDDQRRGGGGGVIRAENVARVELQGGTAAHGDGAGVVAGSENGHPGAVGGTGADERAGRNRDVTGESVRTGEGEVPERAGFDEGTARPDDVAVDSAAIPIRLERQGIGSQIDLAIDVEGGVSVVPDRARAGQGNVAIPRLIENIRAAASGRAEGPVQAEWLVDGVGGAARANLHELETGRAARNRDRTGVAETGITADKKVSAIDNGRARIGVRAVETDLAGAAFRQLPRSAGNRTDNGEKAGGIVGPDLVGTKSDGNVAVGSGRLPDYDGSRVHGDATGANGEGGGRGAGPTRTEIRGARGVDGHAGRATGTVRHGNVTTGGIGSGDVEDRGIRGGWCRGRIGRGSTRRGGPSRSGGPGIGRPIPVNLRMGGSSGQNGGKGGSNREGEAGGGDKTGFHGWIGYRVSNGKMRLDSAKSQQMAQVFFAGFRGIFP